MGNITDKQRIARLYIFERFATEPDAMPDTDKMFARIYAAWLLLDEVRANYSGNYDAEKTPIIEVVVAELENLIGVFVEQFNRLKVAERKDGESE